nr:hypothetical protein [Tanacetum cinerariifolium]
MRARLVFKKHLPGIKGIRGSGSKSTTTKSDGKRKTPTLNETSLAIPIGLETERSASSRVMQVGVSSGSESPSHTESGMRFMLALRSTNARHSSILGNSHDFIEFLDLLVSLVTASFSITPRRLRNWWFQELDKPELDKLKADSLGVWSSNLICNHLRAETGVSLTVIGSYGLRHILLDVVLINVPAGRGTVLVRMITTA